MCPPWLMENSTVLQTPHAPFAYIVASFNRGVTFWNPLIDNAHKMEVTKIVTLKEEPHRSRVTCLCN